MCSMQVNLKINKSIYRMFFSRVLNELHLLGLLQSGDEGDDESQGFCATTIFHAENKSKFKVSYNFDLCFLRTSFAQGPYTDKTQFGVAGS